MVFVISLFFFQNQLFKQILSGISPEYQTVSSQIRPDILLLIYKSTTMVLSRWPVKLTAILCRHNR